VGIPFLFSIFFGAKALVMGIPLVFSNFFKSYDFKEGPRLDAGIPIFFSKSNGLVFFCLEGFKGEASSLVVGIPVNFSAASLSRFESLAITNSIDLLGVFPDDNSESSCSSLDSSWGILGRADIGIFFLKAGFPFFFQCRLIFDSILHFL